MEGSITNDPFADSAPGAVADDPFADVPGADEGELAAEVAAEAPPAEEIPVVDREGAEVPPPADGPDPAAPQPPVETEEAAAPAAEAPQPPQEPQEAAPVPAEAPAAPEAAPEPPAAPEPAPAPEPDPAPAAPAEPQEQGGGEQVPEPPKAKGEMRHYKCFYQTAVRAWSEYDLSAELPEGVVVVTIEDEQFFEARNNDHATRIAFAILGQPQDGVTVWPVPRGAYKPKRVKPAPPKPERTRLEIS